MERLWTYNVSIGNGNTEEFNGEFAANIYFMIRHFMLKLLM